MIIKLNRVVTKRHVYMVIENIVMVEPLANGGAEVWFTDGSSVEVSESAEQVVRAMLREEMAQK